MPKLYVYALVAFLAVAAFGGYTAWQRHDAAEAVKNKSAAKTTEKVYDVQGKKNEIRNRASGNSVTVERLRKHTF